MAAEVWVATAPIWLNNVRAYNLSNIVPDSVVAQFGLEAEGLVERRTASDTGVPSHGVDPATQLELDNAIGSRAAVSDVFAVDGKFREDKLPASVPRKGDLVVSVRDYGAKGDGSTDDGAAFAATITAAGVGGSLYIPPGNYKIGRVLLPLDNQRITGAGRHAVTLSRVSSMSQRPLDISGKTGVVLSGFAYDGGRGVNSTLGGAHFRVINSSKCHIFDAHFKNLDGLDTSIELHDSTDCTAHDVTFDTVGYGVVIGSHVGSTTLSARCAAYNIVGKSIDLNLVFATGSTASAVSPATIYGHQVENVICTDFGDTVVEIGQGNVGSSAVNIYGDGNGRGQNVVLVRDNRGTTVTGVRARNMSTAVIGSGASVAINPIFDPIYDCTVSDVTCEQGSYWGVYAKGFVGLTLSNLAISDCVKNIYIPAGDRLVLAGAITQRSQQWGLLIGENNGSGNNVTNFTISGVVACDNNTDQAQAAGGISVQGASSHGTIDGAMAFDSRAGAARTQKSGWYIAAGVADVSVAPSCKSFNNTGTDSGFDAARTVYAPSVDKNSLAIQGLTGQTGDLTQWRDATGTALWRVLLSGPRTGAPELNSSAPAASSGTPITSSRRLTFDTSYWDGSASLTETVSIRGTHQAAGFGLGSVDVSGGVNITPQHAAARGLTVTQPSGGSTDLVRIVDGTGATQAKFDSLLRLNLSKGLVTSRQSQTLAANGAVAIDASIGNDFSITLQANATSSSITNPTAGQRVTVTWVQDATGGRTYAWPTNCKFAGGSAPSDTTANKRTSVDFVYDGTNWNEKARAVAVG